MIMNKFRTYLTNRYRSIIIAKEPDSNSHINKRLWTDILVAVARSSVVSLYVCFDLGPPRPAHIMPNLISGGGYSRPDVRFTVPIPSCCDNHNHSSALPNPQVAP
jgi:hypothetical protein